MKKILMFIVAVMVITFAACSSISEETSPVDNNELVIQGKKFANIHNDCLAEIYKSLVSSKTRNSSANSVSKSDIVKAANHYIAKHIPNTRANSDEIFIEERTYDKTIEDIRNQMSEHELKYIERTLNGDKNYNKIFEDILNDKNISDVNKRAVICFITTYETSSEYWQENLESWEEDVMNTSMTRSIDFNWKNIATTDAYWGYTALLTSGLNLWVGGGAAAVGSACACLK